MKQSSALAGFYLLPYSLFDVPPSDKVRIGHIGVGGMGTQHVKWFAKLPEAQIVALCDVDSTHNASALKELQTIHSDAQPDLYGDFRELLDRSDIDAISCATPDHWHSRVAIEAFKAGKDVYGEKPLSYTIREGQKMLKAQVKNDRIFQLGTQIHAGDNYHRVVEIIQSGVLGSIHTVRLWKTGAPPVFPTTQIQTPPSHLDWDFWQGPAPVHPYDVNRCHFNYRYFMDYSGGVFADFWCHIADVVFWALNPNGLSQIEARGKVSEGIGDTPEWLEVDYTFEDLTIHWTSVEPDVPGAAGKSIGAYFEGEHGTLLCNYGDREIRMNGEIFEDIEEVPITIKRSPGHQQNFLDSVKSRKQPQSNLAYARKMTLPMHLGLITWQLQRPLKWNAKKEKFISDQEANSYLDRWARRPFR